MELPSTGLASALVVSLHPDGHLLGVEGKRADRVAERLADEVLRRVLGSARGADR